MAKLNLSIAVRDYDRTRPLSDGIVQIHGVDPVFMALDPEEIFFRAFHLGFDICELSMSSFTVKTAQGIVRMWACRLSSPVSSDIRPSMCVPIASRSRRTSKKKIGVPEYQLTANVWACAILEDDHGVKPSDIHWIRGGLEEAGRPKKMAIVRRCPKNVSLENAPEGRDPLEHAGGWRNRRVHRAACSVGFRTPSAPSAGSFPILSQQRRIISSAPASFPIMHIIGVKRKTAQAHPWLPGAVFKAFERSKAIALEKLADTSSTKVTLPFVEERSDRSACTNGR